MIEINLIPDVKKELIKANKTRNVVVSTAIFIGIAAVAIVVVLGIVIGGQAVTSSAQNSSIESESKTLKSVNDLSKMLTIQNQLGTISALNDGKPITSRVLGLLDVIYSSGSEAVEISNFRLDVETNTLNIEGQTAAGYPGIEAMIKTLNVAEFSYSARQDKSDESAQEPSKESMPLLSETATSGDVTYGRDSDGAQAARFELTLVLAPEFLDAKNEEVVVNVINGGNVTDSYLGIPKSIFAEKAKDIKSEGTN